jgi:hypothetical protein
MKAVGTLSAEIISQALSAVIVKPDVMLAKH